MCLSDLSTLQLAIVGILVSVLTLVYATVISKREEYRSIRKSTDANLRNRAVELIKDINKLKSYCKQLLEIIVVSFLFYLLFTIANNLCDDVYLCLATCIAGALTVLVFVWLVIVSVKVVRFFNKLDNKES